MSSSSLNDNDDKQLQISLAKVQIVTTVLLTMGSTLFAVGIGFGVTIPPTLQQIINDGVERNIEFEILDILSTYAFNYSLILVLVGIALIVAGIANSSAGLRKITKRFLK